MKKSNRLLIKIGLMFICFFLGTLCNNSVNAELYLNNVVTTGDELWKKAGNYDIYCISPSKSFEGGKFKVTEKYVITDNKVEATGTGTNTKENKEKALKRAYILSEPKDGDYNNAFGILTGKGFAGGGKRALENGIYDVL